MITLKKFIAGLSILLIILIVYFRNINLKENNSEPEIDEKESWIEEKMKSMSLEEKIGQMLIVYDYSQEVDDELLNKLNEYEEIFFQWLDASSSKDVPLINAITTGKSRNKIVDRLFETMFSDNLLEGYNVFEHYRKHENVKRTPNNNIVQLKEKNTLVDDLDL